MTCFRACWQLTEAIVAGSDSETESVYEHIVIRAERGVLDRVRFLVPLSVIGLVWRQQRTALLGWVIGMLGFGLVFGALSAQIEGLGGAATEWV